MPEIENEVTVDVKADSFYFSTQCNGDKLVISRLVLSQEQAAALAWVVNHDPETVLEVQIKVKE